LDIGKGSRISSSFQTQTDEIRLAELDWINLAAEEIFELEFRMAFKRQSVAGSFDEYSQWWRSFGCPDRFSGIQWFLAAGWVRRKTAPARA
jgi:hypothetical protein